MTHSSKSSKTISLQKLSHPTNQSDIHHTGELDLKKKKSPCFATASCLIIFTSSSNKRASTELQSSCAGFPTPMLATSIKNMTASAACFKENSRTQTSITKTISTTNPTLSYRYFVEETNPNHEKISHLTLDI